jgi:predicted HTH transcriptional regulator
MTHHILKLIAEGEHQQLDFKFEVADAQKIARSLAAFANTDGGRLLVGVRDNGSLAGVRSEEEYYMVESASSLYCIPPVRFSVREWNINRKNILEVIIPKSDRKPHFVKQSDGSQVAFHRVGDQVYPVNRILIQFWRRETKETGVYLKFTDAEKFLLSYLETHESITVSGFIRLGGIHKNKAERILVNMLLLKLITMHFTENSTYFRLRKEENKTLK